MYDTNPNSYFDKQNMVCCEKNIFATMCFSPSQPHMMSASWNYGHMTTNVHHFLYKGVGQFTHRLIPLSPMCLSGIFHLLGKHI